MDTRTFRALTDRQRALVAVAVLLDGREGGVYLQNDEVNGEGLQKAAGELAAQEPDLRMPYVGSLLRKAFEELAEKDLR